MGEKKAGHVACTLQQDHIRRILNTRVLLVGIVATYSKSAALDEKNNTFHPCSWNTSRKLHSLFFSKSFCGRHVLFSDV